MYPHKPTILCVDDDPAILDLLEHILVPWGFEVIKATDGQAAIEMVTTRKVDLVLLDVILPGIDGFAVCKHIKEIEELRGIPVIMITGLSSKADRIRGIEAGVEHFISKPFHPEELLLRVKMLLKMRKISDNLNLAYDNLTNLTSFGVQTMESFSPIDFDFYSRIDSIVQLLIGTASRKTDNPETIIVGINDGSEYQWYQYEYNLSSLHKILLTIDLQNYLNNLLRSNDLLIFHYNESDIEIFELLPFINALTSIGMSIYNIVCCLSNDLCILALNYGRDVTKYDAFVLHNLVMQGLFLKRLSSQIKETEEAFAYLINCLARAAEIHDASTGSHILRVGEYCALIAEGLGMDKKFVMTIRIQAQLHDVGKIHIDSEILKNSESLSPEEWEVMKQHTLYGARIIGDHSQLQMGRNIALSHHERWDGSGYPHGLKCEQIPLEGRIMNLVDQYDVLRNPRIYKSSLDHETSYKILIEGDGRTMPTHFDPQILAVFKKLNHKFNEISIKLKQQVNNSM